MVGVAIITEASIGAKDRAWVDVCLVQRICAFDPVGEVLVSEVDAGSGNRLQIGQHRFVLEGRSGGRGIPALTDESVLTQPTDTSTERTPR